MAEKQKEPFSAARAALDLQSRKGKQDEAIEKASAIGKAKKKKGARKKEAPPLSEIKKSKHKGSEGETSYGQRMKESPMGKTKTRFNQTGN